MAQEQIDIPTPKLTVEGPGGTANHQLHDPAPWVTYTMQTGSAGGWAGSSRFMPRPGYCQSQTCYTKKTS